MIENEKFYSDYARVFDKDCPMWNPDRLMNNFYITAEECYFNDVLKYRGYVFLRDVYEKFGWPINQASINCGWHRNSDIGDHRIEFTAFESADINDFDIIIDFNVDGDITGYFK